MAKAQKTRETASATANGLAITAQGEAPLSKKQVEFNKLTKKIEKLRKDIAAGAERNAAFIKAMGEFYIPAAEQVSRTKIELAFALEQGALGHKFSKPQKENIGICIVDLCSQAFELIVPTDEEKALYDRWSETSYDEEVEMQEDDEKGFLESLFREVFGVDVDLNKLRNDPEKFAEVQEEIQRKMADGTHDHAKQAKRKTKAQSRAQAAKEAKLKAAEEMKTKSLRSIFIALAKLIHPDMETDPLQRAAKEEEMKKLSEAYEKDDLTTLLAMEMDWIHKQNDHLGSLTEDKLSLYVEVLKDQVRELEQERASYRWDPRYEMIREYTHMQKETGLRRIKNDARELNQSVLDIKRNIRSLQGNNPAKKIKEFVQTYVEEMDMGWWF